MSKAYSNRALPSGTVLREWRLEEVLGVGGFGIVYKGRGIYFNELVAIKEYFPSSISERGEDETVVPIDSDAEEVHALGLKKFVEEAKLLWNLSTPTRHPNIVSVRSLFEIHGTAYMVMDFEDGTSLSRLLKKGQKFNESSLRSMILPIAEGLDRAHRVGVLHRDIKPPNIIINDDGRSVLIDFGSARFESGEATSTKVTFHTPPYAAIEQYVRTFPQGPWTDIYALGVVIFECITGTKPAEVLERMHGDAGTPLAEGEWPGFSLTFLKAVDKAMAVRPDERPQSITEWLELLDHEVTEAEVEDEAATRIGTWEAEAPGIVPVAPPVEGFAKSGKKIDTGVPDTPSKAEFTGKSKKEKEPAPSKAEKPKVELPEPPAPIVEPEKPAAPAASDIKAKDAEAPAAKAPAPADNKSDKEARDPPKPAVESKPKSTAEPKKGLPKGVLIGGVAAVALLAAVGFSFMGGEEKPVATGPGIPVIESDPDAPALEAQAAAELAAAARKAGMSADLVAILEPPAPANEEASATASPVRLTQQVLAGFSIAAVGEAQQLVAKAKGATAKQKSALATATAAVQKSGAAVQESPDLNSAAEATRQLITNFAEVGKQVKTINPEARKDDKARTKAGDTTSLNKAEAASIQAPSGVSSQSTSTAPAPQATSPISGSGVSAARKREFASAVSGARSVAKKVIALGTRDKPGAGASEQEQQDYRVRKGAADAARDYEKYLDGLESSMRGTTSDAEAIQSTAKANQTRGYLSDLLKRSQATLR